MENKQVGLNKNTDKNQVSKKNTKEKTNDIEI
jgi:hypothetical protein